MVYWRIVLKFSQSVPLKLRSRPVVHLSDSLSAKPLTSDTPARPNCVSFTFIALRLIFMTHFNTELGESYTWIQWNMMRFKQEIKEKKKKGFIY